MQHINVEHFLGLRVHVCRQRTRLGVDIRTPGLLSIAHVLYLLPKAFGTSKTPHDHQYPALEASFVDASSGRFILTDRLLPFPIQFSFRPSPVNYSLSRHLYILLMHVS
jgi:hypothetical protein